MKKGIYIVFEGIVGSGKTTQSKMLVERLKKEFPKREVVWTREPGGSEISGAIRKIVQATEFEEEMEPVCEAYLYASARAHSLRRIVQPVIKRGGIVIADRSFITSVAFQGGGRRLGPDVVWNINKIAVDGIFPDMVFFLNLDLDQALERTRDKIGDKFERMKRDFFSDAVKGYKYARKKLGKIWVNIDGSKTVEEINQEILDSTIKLLKLKNS